MEANRDRASDAEYSEVSQVVTAESLADVSVSELAEAVPGYVVVQDASSAPVVSGNPFPEAETDQSDESDKSDLIAVEISEETEFKPDEEAPPHKNGKLKHVIECMLFVASEPMSAKQMAETLEIEEDRVEDALKAIEEDLEGGHGLQLARVAGGYQLCTKSEFGDYCAMILQPAKKKLSKAALETLAVVAYRQPCTMPEIEAVRGVSVDGVIKTLIERGLVQEAGRKQAPGRPILYATTTEFLEYFGLNDISELPDIDMLAVEEVRALEAQKQLIENEPAEGETGSQDHNSEE